MTKFFKKSLPATPLILTKGKFKFEPLADGYGYAKISNEYILAEFARFIAKGIGGLKEIAEEEYQEAIKKNESLKERASKLSFKDQPMRVVSPPPVNPRKPRPAAVKPTEKAAVPAVSDGLAELPLPSPFKDGKMVGYKPDVDKLLKTLAQKRK